jgi:hypothetical protein
VGWWLGWRKTRGSGARGGACGSSGRGEPEETSMVPVDGSAGNAVAGLGCGVIERRGAAVYSAVAQRTMKPCREGIRPTAHLTWAVRRMQGDMVTRGGRKPTARW